MATVIQPQNLPEQGNKGRRRARLARPNLRSRNGGGREGASRKATAPHGLGGQSARAGISKVQPGASWNVCFGDGH